MSSDLDVFVGNTTLIDEEVYRLWLDGHSVAEAVARRLRGGVLEREGTSVAVLQSDTRDHYRTFQMLERLLHAPPRLLQQLLFQIPPERQALLVQRYYAFDEALARELLGKKLSKGTKKELDEVSARTGVGIRSCRRQGLRRHRVLRQQPLRDGQEAPAVPELRGLRCLRPEHDGPLEPGGPGARGGRARRGPAQVLPAGPEGAEGAGERQGPAGPAQEPGVLGPAGEDLGLQRAGGQFQGAVAGPGERGGEADPRPRRAGFLRGPGGEGDRALPLRQVEPGGPAALPDALYRGPPKPAGLQAPGAVGALHGRHHRLPAAHVPRLTPDCAPKQHPREGHCTPKRCHRDGHCPPKQHPREGHCTPKQHPREGHCTPKRHPRDGHCPPKQHPREGHCTPKQHPRNEHCAPKRHPREGHCTPKQHPRDGHCTPKRHPRDGHCTPKQHPRVGHCTPKQHPRDGHCTPKRHPRDGHCTPKQHPRVGHCTPKQHPRDGHCTPKQHPREGHCPPKQHPREGHCTPKRCHRDGHCPPKQHPRDGHCTPKQHPRNGHCTPQTAPQRWKDPEPAVPPDMGVPRSWGYPKSWAASKYGTPKGGGTRNPDGPRMERQPPRIWVFGEPREGTPSTRTPQTQRSSSGSAPKIGTLGMGGDPKKGGDPQTPVTPNSGHPKPGLAQPSPLEAPQNQGGLAIRTPPKWGNPQTWGRPPVEPQKWGGAIKSRNRS
ncbi:acidic fibroblast growth factor intracellular-binding protein isoform X1 [Haemorhous mexicanus]|uniref:acidic fibroblast growth factor intracellular-binding protein isoform X1 n=1 Tax=Haemorhous mexicanus TaxID=30427 RepID=UPI0028BE63DB|nr:acidic fibroblast growth factor intracellular-binding protein isoform X1 [Haemorhous mexicanus]